MNLVYDYVVNMVYDLDARTYIYPLDDYDLCILGL